MGREVRRVPGNWQHPKAFNHHRQQMEYVPLRRGGGFATAEADWNEEYAQWQKGLCRNYGGGEKWTPIDPEDRGMRYTDYSGPRPSPDDYMPDWPEDQLTHLMMYENTSEGTPISPAFETPEELARWLADNGASSFAGMTATYEQWLRVCQGGYAPSMIVQDGRMESGVAGLS